MAHFHRNARTTLGERVLRALPAALTSLAACSLCEIGSGLRRFWGIGQITLGLWRCALRPRERSLRHAIIARSEGNEATCEGRQEVGVLRSASEAGEPTQGISGREESTGTWECLRGNMAGTSSSTTISTKLEQLAKLASEVPQVALTTLAHIHRHRLAARGVSALAHGRGHGCKPADGRAVREELGGKSPLAA
jgi:hypothetical protein